MAFRPRIGSGVGSPLCLYKRIFSVFSVVAQFIRKVPEALFGTFRIALVPA
jgi:hypothetical protein